MITFLKSTYHYCLACLGNILYGFPSKKIFVLGVTGTKGKSTTLELINAILEAAGKKTALVSSIRFKVGDDSKQNTTGMTMPGRFFIQRFLRKAVNSGCQYFLMEVTSQGILQHRHRFIDFDAAIFTNLHPEHIESHGSFEKYRDAKISFFRYVAGKSKKFGKLFFINKNDAAGARFADRVIGSGKVVYFAIDDFVRRPGDGRARLSEWLKNDFNMANAAAAAAFAESQNIGWPIIEKTFSSFSGVPGRMEYISREPFAVVIDYAHTPDSLEKVYQALRGAAPGNLICVFGAAGGGRDKWKRPVMGKIAAEYCDQIILTNEDPYDEQPEAIINQIADGCSQVQNPPEPKQGLVRGTAKSKIQKIINRREAINNAIDSARKGDAVIITGKGSEPWMHVARGEKIPWNEKETVLEILKNTKI